MGVLSFVVVPLLHSSTEICAPSEGLPVMSALTLVPQTLAYAQGRNP